MFKLLAYLKKYKKESVQKKISDKELNSILRFFITYKDRIDKCVRGFAKISREYTDDQIQIIIDNMPLDVRIILEENSKEYLRHSKISVKNIYKSEHSTLEEKNLDIPESNKAGGRKVIIPNQMEKKPFFKRNK